MIDTLTSLRFFFAMLVFGSHCYVIDNFFGVHCFKEGFAGVSFFFVLSGFIIAYNYQDKFLERKTGKRTFWVARFARVYPLHWLTLFVAAALGYYGLALGFADWLKHFAASFTLTQAFIPKPDYFFSFNSPSWSLCCEQLFYFCFPFLVPLAKDCRRLLGLFAVMAVAVVAGMYLTPEEKIKGLWYVNPITRFPDFIVGMLLFRLYEQLKAKRVSLLLGSTIEGVSLLVFLTFYLMASNVPKVYRYSCYYWVPVTLVLLSFSLQRGIFSRMLSCRLLIVAGEISYSFYLIHLFLILSFDVLRQKMEINLPWQVSVPMLFTLAVGLSWLSYYYFEKPLNRKIKLLLNKQHGTTH